LIGEQTLETKRAAGVRNADPKINTVLSLDQLSLAQKQKE
jgi:hypothetical protein